MTLEISKTNISATKYWAHKHDQTKQPAAWCHAICFFHAKCNSAFDQTDHNQQGQNIIDDLDGEVKMSKKRKRGKMFLSLRNFRTKVVVAHPVKMFEISDLLGLVLISTKKSPFSSINYQDHLVTLEDLGTTQVPWRRQQFSATRFHRALCPGNTIPKKSFKLSETFKGGKKILLSKVWTLKASSPGGRGSRRAGAWPHWRILAGQPGRTWVEKKSGLYYKDLHIYICTHKKALHSLFIRPEVLEGSKYSVPDLGNMIYT